jgi:hypothetical protein
VRRLPPFAAAALAACFVLTACESPGPELKVPTPDPAHYAAVRLEACYAVSPADCWLVGELDRLDGRTEGLVLLSEDGGRQWRRFGGEHLDLVSVKPTIIHFVDRLRGFIGGRRITQDGAHRPVVLRTYDGGGHWLETALPLGDGVEVIDVHTLEFASDFEGYVSVMTKAAGETEVKETVYVTRDAARSFTVAEFRLTPRTPAAKRDESYVPASASNGFRIRRSARPGVTICETTASGGADWMPVSEFSADYVATWY